VTDGEFIIHLHDMARKYDSYFLRKVADRMSELTKENKNAEQTIRLETVGRSTSS